VNSIINNTTLDENEVIIIANGCTDGTRDYIEGLNNPNIKLLWFDKACGFTKAVNEGIKVSKGEYIIILNNDCEIYPYKDMWINLLVDPFLKDINVGITGVKGNYEPSTNRMFLIFCCVMIKKQVFEKVGLLDEMFSPGWGEDIDFCHKAEDDGYKVVEITGNFPLYHASGSTFHDNKENSEAYEKIVKRNMGILKRRYTKSDKKIRYSVVIPTFNQCENLLQPTLESLKANTDLTDVEVIVIANGCTDNTEEYVNSLGEPFRVLVYNEQLGFTKATNIGIKDALGEYIVLLNNDVILYWSEKGWLNILREPFDSGEKVGMTGVMLFKGDVGFSND